MSSKYELTISSDYVKDWGVYQAVREFFQNAIDRAVQNPESSSFFNYSPETQILTIGNRNSVLNIESLLLGVSTKTDDEDTIGQFGEGYKIATMVLLRSGHPVTFYNYGNKEVWTTKLVKSRRYNGKLVPTFYVDRNYPWKSVPNVDLTITIENITPEEYTDIQNNILELCDDVGKTLECPYGRGRILLSEQFKGKVFVSGLFVCENKRLSYGYDISPRNLRLDRDRQTVSDFDLVWETSRMWSTNLETEEFSTLFYSEDPYDILYMDSMSTFDSFPQQSKQEFFTKYGKEAIPVLNQEEYNRVLELGGKPVFVTRPVGNCFRSVYNDFANTSTVRPSAYTALSEWFEELNQEVSVPTELYDKFENILERYQEELT